VSNDGDVDDFFDQENDDPAKETREQRHARRVRQAKEKLDGEIGKEVIVNDTTWKVVREHHCAPAPDTVGKPELIGFDFDNFNLLRLFRHMYPGVPEEDIDRANSFMAHRYSQWREITVREWFLWHGLLIAATLYGSQVRRALFPRAMFPSPRASDSRRRAIARRRADSERALTYVPPHVTRAGQSVVGHQNRRVGPGAEFRTVRHVVRQVLRHLRGRRVLQIGKQPGTGDG
jgi:hypothetical protein